VGNFNGDNLSDYAVGVLENTGGTDSGSVFFVIQDLWMDLVPPLLN